MRISQKGLLILCPLGSCLIRFIRQKEDGTIERSIDKIKALNEISVVTVPAYDSSNVQVNKRSYESFMSNNQAKQTNNSLESTSKAQKESNNMENFNR